MNVRLRQATSGDRSALLPFMQGYYRDDGLEFAAANARALAVLLATPDAGRVWWIERDAGIAGYVAVCFGFSLELGGRDAYIDELYVAPEMRGGGIAKAALRLLLDEVRALGIQAIYLEVDMTNERAVR